MCACVSNNEYAIPGPDTCTSNFRGILRLFFLIKRLFQPFLGIVYFKVECKTKTNFNSIFWGLWWFPGKASNCKWMMYMSGFFQVMHTYSTY